MDPTKRLILTKAVWPNKEDWKGKRKNDLRLQLKLFAKDLESLTELSAEKQWTLMNACVDLSISLVREINRLKYV